MKTIKEAAKEVPVAYEADVIVVGGGPGGIGAALAAARNGVKTILLEQFNFLGGAGTNCLVHGFCGVDFNVSGGIFEEVCKGLEEGGAIFEKTWLAYSYDHEYYKYLLDNMMEKAGVKLIYHAFGVDAVKEGNSVKGVIIECKEGRLAILGKMVVDCTGTADIAWKCGAQCMEGGHPSERHLGYTWTAVYRGIDLYALIRLKQEQPEEWGGITTPITHLGGLPIWPYYVGGLGGARELVKKGRESGELYMNHEYLYTALMDGGRASNISSQYSLPKGQHSWSLENMSNGEIDLRKQNWSILRFLKKHVRGFENADMEQTPVHAFLRDAHRIIGDYVLNWDDTFQGRSFEDSIGICCYFRDIHGPDDGHQDTRPDVPLHDIPYRCLYSKDTENLLAAGSIISTDFFTWATIRMMTTSMVTGQAAGTAAALCVKNKVTPRRLDVKLLQQTLEKQGQHTTLKHLPKKTIDEYQQWVEMLRPYAEQQGYK